MPRTPCLWALLAIVAVFAAPHAAADEVAIWERLAGARKALLVNDAPTARELLFDRVLAKDVSDQELVLVARLGFHLGDRDVLQELRAVLDERNQGGTSLTRALAAGWAYVGLAQHYIRTQKSASSIPMLFEDAGNIAKEVLASDETTLRSAAHLLAARIEATQARSEAALAALAAASERAPAWAPAMDGLEGRLRYDRGAAMALDADGRPTEAAVADLTRGHALMDAALADPTQTGFTKEGLESLIARRAWASHRLGQRQRAEAEYGALYERGAQGQSLAVRGLSSLYADSAAEHQRALRALARDKGPAAGAAWKALITTQLQKQTLGPALLSAQAYLALGDHADAWAMHGIVLRAMRAWTEAEKSFAKALLLKPEHALSAYHLELMARGLVASDAHRAIEMYEHLLRLRPANPYVRNNLGFILRDLVSPHTTIERGSNLQRIKPDAPDHVRTWLARSVSAYAEAVALIDAEDDGQREIMDDWNLAGIVNDYALMLHYFLDVQDAPKAEALYLRALRMTDYGFKDTYAPNLQRLYHFVLPGRELQWWRLAEKAQDAIMLEQPDDQGGVELAPDDRKRESARRDRDRLRTQLLKELGVANDTKKGPR